MGKSLSCNHYAAAFTQFEFDVQACGKLPLLVQLCSARCQSNSQKALLFWLAHYISGHVWGSV